MTDKLLAKIEEEIAKIETWLDEEESWTSQGAIDDARFMQRAWQALLFAVERHGPVEQDFTGTQFDGLRGELVCSSCWEPDDEGELCSIKWPCTEYKGIATRLGVEL